MDELGSPGGKSKYGRQRLAVLNMMHSKQLLDISSGGAGGTLSSPSKRSYDEYSTRHSSGIVLPSPLKNNTIRRPYNDEENFLESPSKYSSVTSLRAKSSPAKFQIKMDFGDRRNSHTSAFELNSPSTPTRNAIGNKLDCLNKKISNSPAKFKQPSSFATEDKKVSKRTLRLKLLESNALVRVDFSKSEEEFEKVKVTVEKHNLQ